MGKEDKRSTSGRRRFRYQSSYKSVLSKDPVRCVVSWGRSGVRDALKRLFTKTPKSDKLVQKLGTTSRYLF